MADRWLADPRPDLGGGAPYRRLLAFAWMLDGHEPAGLFGALHALRCCGAAVDADPERGGRLLRGEIPEPEYAALRRRYLLPRTDELRRLLGELRIAP